MNAAKQDADFLVEVGTEELPPTSLVSLIEAFATGLASGLDSAGLGHGGIESFATPRRLAVRVRRLSCAQADRTEELRGPPVSVAYDKDGNPGRALLAFAEKCGVGVDAMTRVSTDKGEWVACQRTTPGRAAVSLMPELVEAALDSLPVARRMRWGAGDAEFVRPVQWLVMLYGEQVVEANLFGQDTGRETYGHRFHAPEPISLGTPADYEHVLLQTGKVVADFPARRKLVDDQVRRVAVELGAGIEDDPALLDEVTAMVEWPVAIAGSFAESYLELPREVLISTLKKHQRYFPVVDGNGQLRANFITVANIESKNPAAVAAGNERVVTPRLADAEFFWRSDRKAPLAAREERLRDVVYEAQLGSIYDKSQRVASLAVMLADTLGSNADVVARAGRLSRCDLVSDLVGEFPDLQGIMGSYYAQADGEPAAVVDAIRDFYRPAYSGDTIPVTMDGRILAAADRLDSLSGVFAIGKRPKGNRDPFGLRRAALGLARIMIEGELEFDLRACIDHALDLQPVAPASQPSLVDELYDFVTERLRAYYTDVRPQLSSDQFEAVRVRRPGSLLDFDARVAAVAAFSAMPEAQSLAAANKRIGNILRQAGVEKAKAVDVSRLVDEAEIVLAAQFGDVAAKVDADVAERRYTEAFSALAALRDSVDSFFDKVMVLCEDEALRRNRLNLLAAIHASFLSIADISVLSRS